MKSASQPSLQDHCDDIRTAIAARSWRRPSSPVTLLEDSRIEDSSKDPLNLAITRDWLLGVDRERRNARHRNGKPVRIWSIPVKKARLSVAGLMVDMPSFMEAQEQFIRCYLRHVLTVSGGNVSWAARLARRNRTGFHRLLVKYSLAAADFRNAPHLQGSPGAAVPIARFNGPGNSAAPFS